MAGKERTEAEMGSNLRGDYYYPTARKRYLPRIRKADEALDVVRTAPPAIPQQSRQRNTAAPLNSSRLTMLFEVSRMLTRSVFPAPLTRDSSRGAAEACPAMAPRTAASRSASANMPASKRE